MKNYLIIATFVFFLFVLSGFENTALAQIVPCSGIEAKDGLPACDFNQLMQLAKNIINWLLMFSTAIAAACFFYAGYLYLTSSGNPSHVTRAHSIFKNVVVGIIIALAAWLIVNTIITTLVAKPADYTLLN